MPRSARNRRTSARVAPRSGRRKRPRRPRMPASPPRPAPTREPQQDGLCLIVRRVPEHDVRGLVLCGERRQGPQAHVSGPRLQPRARRDGHGAHGAADAERRSQALHRRAVLRARRPAEAVIDVGRGQPPAGLRRQRGEAEKQRGGIRAARRGHQQVGARRYWWRTRHAAGQRLQEARRAALVDGRAHRSARAAVRARLCASPSAAATVSAHSAGSIRDERASATARWSA